MILNLNKEDKFNKIQKLISLFFYMVRKYIFRIKFIKIGKNRVDNKFRSLLDIIKNN